MLLGSETIWNERLGGQDFRAIHGRELCQEWRGMHRLSPMNWN